MAVSFVDALAGAIVRELAGHTSPSEPAAAAPRGAPVRRSGRPPNALAALDPAGIGRVASAIAGQMANGRAVQELPLETIEI